MGTVLLNLCGSKRSRSSYQIKKGPVLLHAHVTRPYSHSMSDDQTMYRTKEELEIEKEKDVVNSYPKTLTNLGLLSDAEVQKIKDSIKASVKDVILPRQLATPWQTKDTSTKHLFSEDVDISSDQFDNPSDIKGKEDVPMAKAINKVLRSEVSKKPFN